VIRGYKGVRPTLGARAFVDASAQVTGLRAYAANCVGYRDTCQAEVGECEEGR
jgi:hypothetical protein